MKKIISFLIAITLLFGLSTSVLAFEMPEGEDYLYSFKTGRETKVYHFGTGEPVTLPKQYFEVEAEMRGVWVATVYNIAIGKQNGTSQKAIDDYKKEFLTILDRMEAFGMNTLFFQVRPANDAFYSSKLNPWSEFLVGAGIDPGWDPLAWMIEETHKRGFDFECWMNAYRVTTSSVLPDSSKVASTYSNDELVKFKEKALVALANQNFAKLHPEYVVMGESDTRLILNPSEIAVQDFIVASLKEIIENYDIDGMHFDDYFYLNGQTSSDLVNTNFAGGKAYDANYTGEKLLNDLANYQEYLDGNSKYAHMERGYNLGDFRRENINVMMRRIRAMVDEYNEQNNEDVEFGSKPAAVWRSNSQYCSAGSTRCSPIGSNTHEGAYSSYSDLFADTWKWVEEGLVDFVAPQVYYAFEDNIAGYADIVDWWASMVSALNEQRKQEGKKEIKLYIAHGIYKYRDAPTQFYNSSEIRNQLKYNQKHEAIKGSAVYSYENLYQFSNPVHEDGIRYFKNTWYNAPTYPLPHGENDAQNLKITDYKTAKDKIDGSYTITFNQIPNARVYGLYKVKKGTTFDPKDLSTRIQIQYSPYVEGEKEVLRIYDYDEDYDYYVKIVSKNGHLSEESTYIDFSNTSEYESIKVNYLSPVSSQILKGDTITIRGKVSSMNSSKLTYKVWYMENGVDRERLLGSGNVINQEFVFQFKAYSYNVDNVAFKFEFTDGNATIFATTNTFDIVSSLTDVMITSLDSVLSGYQIGSEVAVYANVHNPNQESYVYRIYMVNEETNEKTLVEEQTTKEVIIRKLVALKNISFTRAHFLLEIEMSTYTNKVISTPFDIYHGTNVKFPNIQVDSFQPTLYQNIKIQVDLQQEENFIPYYISLVNESYHEIQSLASGYANSNTNVIICNWFVEYSPTSTYYVKVQVGDNSNAVVQYSNKIQLQYPSHIVNDNIHLSETKVKPGKEVEISFQFNNYEEKEMTYQVWLVDSTTFEKKGNMIQSGTSTEENVTITYTVPTEEGKYKIWVEVIGDSKTTHMSDVLEVTKKASCGSCNKGATQLVLGTMALSTALLFLRKRKG